MILCYLSLSTVNMVIKSNLSRSRKLSYSQRGLYIKKKVTSSSYQVNKKKKKKYYEQQNS